MKSIDEKVVEMRFDNRNFEKNVDTTINSLDNLNKSLQFDGVVKNIENVGDSFGSLVKKSIVFTTVSNLVTDLENKVVSLWNRFSQIATAKEGFGTYENKMGSVQTIMSSTGKSLDEVNAVIADLQDYADQTIYSLDDMTTSLAKFVNAGRPLEDAAAAIKGVSNAAALAGATTQQASIAMYNLSQSMSLGYVEARDWRSVMNANISNKTFRNELILAAEALGTVKKTEDGLYKTLKGKVLDPEKEFVDTLQDQWLTAEALTKALGNLGDENTEVGEKAFDSATKLKTFSMLLDTLRQSIVSQWSRSWEIVIGNLDEATEVWTKVGAVVGGFFSDIAKARDALLQGWKDLGGREELLTSFANIFKALQAVIAPITKAFREIFPKKTADDLKSITMRFRRFTETLMPAENMTNALYNVFKDIFKLIKSVSSAISKVSNVVLPVLFGAVSKVFNFIFDSINKVHDYIANNKLLSGLKESVTNGAKAIYEKISGLFGKKSKEEAKEYTDTVAEGFEEATEKTTSFKDSFINAWDEIKERFKDNALFRIFTSLYEVTKTIGSLILNTIAAMFESISSSVKKLDVDNINNIIKTAFSGGFFVGLIVLIKKVSEGFSSVTDSIKGLGGMFKGISSVATNFSSIFGNVAETIKTYQTQIKANALRSIAVSLLILVGALLLLSTINKEDIGSGIVAMGALLTELLIFLSAFTKITKGSKKLFKYSMSLIAISVSVLILASALKKMSALDWDGTKHGLLAMAGILAMLIVTVKILSDGKRLKKGMLGLVSLAIAVRILAGVIVKLSKLDYEDIGRGLVVMGGILLEMVAFVKILGNAKGLFKMSLTLVPIALAITILAIAFKIFASNEWDAVGRGLVALGGSLLIVSAIVKYVKMSLFGAASLLIVATALIGFAASMKILGSMEWGNIARALTVLAGGLLILSVGLKMIKRSISGSLALIVASAALTVFAISLASFGLIKPKTIIKALVSLAATFIILGVAGHFLAPIVGTIMKLGVAVAIVGAGIALAGVGFLALGAGITAFTLAIAGSSVVILESLETITTIISTLVPNIAASIAKAIGSFFKALGEEAEGVGEGLRSIIKSVVTVLTETLPDIMKLITVFAEHVLELVFDLLIKLLDLLSENIEPIVIKVVDVVNKLLITLASKMPEIVDTAFKLIISFINGLADAVRNNAQAIADAAWNLITAFIDALVTFAKTSWEKLKEIGKNIVQGFIEGIKSMFNNVKDTVSNLFKKVIGTSEETLDEHSPSKVFKKIGRYVDEGFIDGLEEYSNKVLKSSKNLGETAIDGVKDGLDGMDNLLDSTLDHDPTIRPVLDLSNIEAGAKNIDKLLDSDNMIAMSAGIHGSSGFNSELVVNMTINGAEGQDINQLAEIISEKLNDSIRRRESSWQ